MEQKGWFRIVNWRKLQNYVMRKPPWIRFYTSVIWDEGPQSRWHAAERWRSLGLAGQGLLMNIWAYAAVHTMDGKLWGDPEYLEEVLHIDPADRPIDLEPLFAGHFLEWLGRDSGPALEESVDAGDDSYGLPGDEREREGTKREERERAEKQRDRATENRVERAEPADSGSPSGASASGTAETERESPERERAEPAESTGPAQRQAQPSSAAPRIVIANPAPPSALSAVPPFPPDSDSPREKTLGGFYPGRSVLANLGISGSLGASLPGWAKALADPQRDAWVREIFRLLQYPYVAESVEGRQEIGTFARLYDRLWEEPLASVLSDRQRDTILAHDIKTAREKGRARGNRRRGAVFVHIHWQRVYECLNRLGRDDIIRQLQRQRRADRQERAERWNDR